MASIGHHRQDRAHVGLVAAVGGKDDGRARLADAAALEIVGVGDVAADEVHAVAGRVALRFVEQHDLGLELVALQLVDEVAGGLVPAADDDVIAVARGAHALALLEKEIDDESDDCAGDGGHDRDSEEREQPADHEPAGRAHVAGVAGSDDGRDGPVEAAAQPAERALLVLEQRDRHRGDEHEGDHPGQERREEMAVHLAADAPRVEADAPQQRSREQGPQRVRQLGGPSVQHEPTRSGCVGGRILPASVPAA